MPEVLARRLAIGVAAASMLTAARAADFWPSARQPGVLPPSALVWEGFYAGTIVGAGRATVTSRALGSRTVSVSGATGGGLVGYNWRHGPLVIGAEGDITLHLIRGEDLGARGLAPSSVDALYSARLRGRIGYVFGPILPFIAAGGAMSELYQRDFPPTVRHGDVQRMLGWTLGAGVDWQLSAPVVGPFVLRAEYVYEGFPERSFDLLAGPLRSKQYTQFVRAALIWQSHAPAPPSLAEEPEFVDWSGPYGGLIVGASSVSVRTTSGAARTSFSAAGPLGGLYVGSNYMFGRWLVGAEGDIEITDFSGSGAQPNAPRTSFRNYIQAGTRLRLGYAFGRLLPYVAAGLVRSRSEQKDLFSGSENGRVPTEAWTLGVGFDYRILDRISIRVEYLFESTYASKRPGLDGCGCTQSLRSNTARVGTTYHF